MKCRKCDQHVDENWKCCPYCGSDVQKEKPDSTPCTGIVDGKPCGYNLPALYTFCPICRTKNNGGQTKNVSGASAIDSDYENEPDCAGGDTLDPEFISVLLEEEEKNSQLFNKDSELLLSSEATENEEKDMPADSDVKKRLHEVGVLKQCQARFTYGKFVSNLTAKIKECDNEVVKFGVTGRSGMGKSSFINLLLGAEKAEIGSGDTTKEVTEYEHPKSNHFTITDMPGFGTVEMPKSRFLEKVNLSQYDYFFIFIEYAFSEDDVWIANQLMKLTIPFCFVRAKMDIYANSQEAKKIGNHLKAVRLLRERLEQTMKKVQSLRHADLFLITNWNGVGYRFDFYRLIRKIAKELRSGKSDFLIMYLPISSPEAIEIKLECFRCRSVLLRIIRRLKIFFYWASSYEFMKQEMHRCYRALQLDHDYVHEVDGLQHVLSLRKELPGKDNSCWEDISYLDKNYEILGKDARKVYWYYHNE